MIANDMNFSRPPAPVKPHPGRCLFFAAALLLTFSQHGRAAGGGQNAWLDENQVRQVMRQEAFRLLAEKIDAARNGEGKGFDYHIEQAYEKIKNRLPSDPLSASELEAWLQQFLPDRKAADGTSEFWTLIGNFSNGMSLEIINTLQFECEQAEDLIAQVGKLAGELKRSAHPDRDALDLALRQLGLGKKTAGVIKDAGRSWQVPAAGVDSFSAFNTWKKNMTGRNADKDQRLVFDLGDRYQFQNPFLGGFMENYRRLAEAFRRAVQELNAGLDNGGEPAR
jgi:hypothetical protein